VEPDEQLDRPYEEWAQPPPVFKKAWKRRVSMGALGAGAGLLVGALVHGIVAVTRPELQGEISWRLLGCSCCGGALCAFIESWKR
jgi:hypothetical protein